MGKIQELELDVWSGVECSTDSISEPDQKDIKTAINKLDSHKHSIASLIANDGRTLRVAGGERGQYLLVYTDSDGYSKSATGEGDGLVAMVVGGQRSEFTQNKIFDHERTLKAAQIFAETGQLDSSLRWEDD